MTEMEGTPVQAPSLDDLKAALIRAARTPHRKVLEAAPDVVDALTASIRQAAPNPPGVFSTLAQLMAVEIHTDTAAAPGTFRLVRHDRCAPDIETMSVSHDRCAVIDAGVLEHWGRRD